MPSFIGLDLGTTTVTGVLLDAERGEVLRLAQRPNDAALKPLPATRAEQDPHRLRALALEVLAELAANDQPIGGGRPVDGVAVTGQKHGLLCLDARGQPLTPLISWQDRRTAESLPGGETTLDRLRTRVADLDWHENGCRIQHGYGAATLFWLVGQGELPSGTRWVCTLADWLVGQLTARPPVTDLTLAASWGLYSLVDGAWNAAFLDRLGLEARLFPPVRPSGERQGGLAPGVVRQIGLPDGLPVSNALGDTQASFLGASYLSTLPPPFIFFNLGTGGQVCWAVPAFEPPSEVVETRPLPGGRFLRVGASLCGGAAYAWLNRTVRAWLAEFGADVDKETVYERLNTLAAACDDTRGLRVRTSFLGVRGNPAVRAGAIEGLTLEEMGLGVLARATLIGIVDELHGLYHAHVGHAQPGPTRLVAAGGAVRKNPLLPGLLEERFGLPVEIPREREIAAVGAAALL